MTIACNVAAPRTSGEEPESGALTSVFYCSDRQPSPNMQALALAPPSPSTHLEGVQ